MEYILTAVVILLAIQVYQVIKLNKLEQEIEILEDYAELSALKIEDLKDTVRKFDTPF